MQPLQPRAASQELEDVARSEDVHLLAEIARDGEVVDGGQVMGGGQVAAQGAGGLRLEAEAGLGDVSRRDRRPPARVGMLRLDGGETGACGVQEAGACR